MATVESTYVTLQTKKWRALEYNYTRMIDGLDGSSCLVCLTDFQRVWLQSNIDYMRFMPRWSNHNLTQSDFDNMADELELALMSCLDLQPYQLQSIYDSISQETLDNYNALYNNGGIPNLNPNIPIDFYSGDGSQDRLDALCTAISIYIKSYVQNWLAKAQVVLAVTAFLAFATSITIVGGVIAGTILAGLAFITQVAMDAMQDADAIDDVICCMNTALIGTVISSANFETSLDNCGFISGSNQSIIRDIIASDLNQFSNWLSFINSIGNSLEYVQNGIVECPCVATETVTVNFNSTTNINFDLSIDNFLINITDPIDLQSTLEGNPIPSGKMAFGTIQSSGDKSFNGWIRITLPVPKDLTNISMDFRWKSIGAGTSVFRSISFYDTNNNQIAVESSSASAPKNTWNTFTTTVAPNQVKYIKLSVAQSYPSGNPTPSNSMGWIDNVTWTQNT